MSFKQESEQVLALNSMVRLGPEQGLRGQVIAICIRPSGVMYEVVWWVDSQRHRQWLCAAEIVPHEGQETTDVGHYL
ncbi:MAG: hypothetical protein O7G88_20420 [bacterium]|nr:hypothetical protein [bacterium]